MAATGKEAVSVRQARTMVRKIMTDLTNETNRTIQEAVHAEASAREKADQLLETEIDGKLDAADLVAGANVTITPDPETGHVTIAAAGGQAPVAYTAGEGLALSGQEFSIADGGVTAGKIAPGVIPDVSGFITADQAAEAYQPKGDYITAAQAAETYQPKGSYALSSHTHSADDIASGTLPIERGGTGATTAKAAEYAIHGTPTENNADLVDSSKFVNAYSRPNASQGTFFTRTALQLWTYIKDKADSVYAAIGHTHAASQITGLTASRALVSDSSGHPAASAVTSDELGYLDGATSNIQAQLNGKAPTSHTHTVSQITDFPEIPDITIAPDSLAKGYLGY